MQCTEQGVKRNMEEKTTAVVAEPCPKCLTVISLFPPLHRNDLSSESMNCYA